MRDNEFFEILTDLLIEDLETLENNPIKYENPFNQYGTGAYNIYRQDGYSLCNTLYLNIQAKKMDVRPSYLAGYKQWKGLGYQVKSKEKSLRMLNPSGFIVDEDTGERIPKGFTVGAVFSYDQVEPIEDKEQKWTPPNLDDLENSVVPVDSIEHMVKVLGVDLKDSKSSLAFYRPSDHTIHMPPKVFAKHTNIATATENYYSVLLHELTHWTAHKDNCDRDISDYQVDKQARAYEELIAEMGSLFFTTHFKIRDRGRLDHAQYISSWITLLKNKPGILRKASDEAQKAVKLCLGKYEAHGLKEYSRSVQMVESSHLTNKSQKAA